MASLHLHSVAPVAVTRHRATAPSHFKALPSPHSLVPALSSRDTFCHSPLTVPLRPALTVRPARRSLSVPSASAMPAPSPAVPDHLVQFAHRLADAAREVVPPFFRRPISIELKADESPVTAADRAAEEAITALIRAEYPAHGILGEEQGLQGPVGAAGGGGGGGVRVGVGGGPHRRHGEFHHGQAALRHAHRAAARRPPRAGRAGAARAAGALGGRPRPPHHLQRPPRRHAPLRRAARRLRVHHVARPLPRRQRRGVPRGEGRSAQGELRVRLLRVRAGGPRVRGRGAGVRREAVGLPRARPHRGRRGGQDDRLARRGAAAGVAATRGVGGRRGGDGRP
ncbi:hypothetical protein CLOM_g12539 [Closterium sp. NIES-68]|nr:hypothetical protein CLOM_g12539 [Closterium sp. NIES-68]